MTQPMLQTPIAIVGMACRLPGADDLDEFWSLLRDGRDAIGEFPAERLDRELYFDPEKGQRGKTYSTVGGMIPDRPLRHLPGRLDRETIENADPCHRILCDVALEACNHAGFDVHAFPLRNTGVYVGHSAGSPLGGEIAFASLAEETLDYLHDVPEFAALDSSLRREIISQTAAKLRSRRPRRNASGGPDVEANYASSLIARALSLNGPHYVIDAACASSLVALAAASLALNHGSIEAAIVGGASYNKADSLILFSHAQSCSADSSRPFDRRADGLISSEGYVALVAKLLPRAIADGDKIHAVVRSIGLSSDGRGRSLWAPRKEGQIAAVQRAYGNGVEPSDIQFIEAHATSTQVGDATELEALGTFFAPHLRGKKIPLGSVKSNIGHTLETAGLAGLLKTILSIREGQIAPTVHFDDPHPGIPWNELPFQVPTSTQPWPREHDGQPRCAAVNAFGIGGLNVHIVVTEHLTGAKRGSPAIAVTSASKQPAAIAVIGRGAILPGVSSANELHQFMASGKKALSDAPDSRWRKRIGIWVGAERPWTARTARGGFITNYAYDWKKHKIPPKQVAQANPLQFMLLDAAHQALVESGYHEKDFDRAATAVVVGTVFGGEFANHLQVGLRLPEINRDLRHELEKRGVPRHEIDRLLEQFERRLLEMKPALLDETGSFTSSTLASRVSKTLNLMGGAMAIDGGDCSSFAALSLACDLLRAGTTSMAFCAAAQRSMDLPAFESLGLHGRLPADVENGSGGYFPGEGVALVLLKRLDDAQRDGDPVFGVIQGIGAANDSGNLTDAVQVAARRAIDRIDVGNLASAGSYRGYGIDGLDEAEQKGLRLAYGHDLPRAADPLIDRIGHLQAAHGLASLIHATTAQGDRCSGLNVHSYSGLAYHVLMAPPGGAKKVATTPAAAPGKQSEPHRTYEVFRLTASSVQELHDRIVTAATSSPRGMSESSEFDSRSPSRMAIVASSPDDLQAKLRFAAQAAKHPGTESSLADQGIFIRATNQERPRIAFLFPGQGSQYVGMLEQLVASNAAARRALDFANDLLRTMRLPDYAEMAWRDNGKLGSDIRTTQIAVLIADYIALAAISAHGVQPDGVVGHSFGEFAALIAAGAISLEQAIRLTDLRAQAVEQFAAPGTGMVSIEASPEDIESELQAFQDRLFLSHHNAPQQTVAGGFLEALVDFESRLTTLGIRFRRLQVPSAYHTPLMQPMLPSWRESVNAELIRPSKIPLLSSVNNRYTADPIDVRENLVQQMVTPVRYVDLVERLKRDGFTALVEVGPQQVLTRLHRRILKDSPVIVCGIDHPKRQPLDQLTRVLAELECGGWKPAEPSETKAAERRGSAQALLPIEQFDATTARKSRNRSRPRPAVAIARPSEALVAFDATEKRRQRARASAETAAPVLSQAASEWPEVIRPDIADSPVAISAIQARTADLDRVRDVEAEAAESAAALGEQTQGASDEIDKFLVDFVVEHTGYPAELINFDWDMEADLGIDSIKRAQLFGELREMFPLNIAQGGSLDDYRTLRQIADKLRAETSAPARSPGVDASWDPSAGQVAAAFVEPDGLIRGDQRVASETIEAIGKPIRQRFELDVNSIQQFIVDYVVDQTGYPAEEVDIDAEFEADLAIDSIKKAQLLGELREQFELQLPETEKIELSKYRTIRQLVGLVDGSADVSLKTSDSAEPAIEQESIASTSAEATGSSVEPASPTNGHKARTNGHSRRSTAAQDGDRYRSGVERGRLNAATIRNTLRKTADLYHGNGSHAKAQSVGRHRLAEADIDELRGLADGAGIHLDNILAFYSASDVDGTGQNIGGFDAIADEPTGLTRPITEPSPEIAHRYVLRMGDRPRREGASAVPILHGAAVILGDNELAAAIQQRFHEAGKNAYIVRTSEDAEATAKELESIWAREPVPHLFIVTPRDADAGTTWDGDQFDRRRRVGVSTPYWFCQRWLKLIHAAGMIEFASMVGFTSLGGDFGFSGNVHSTESGAIAGLFKSIIIESWVAGFRSLPIKLIDAEVDASTTELVEAAWYELASPSYDVEVNWKNGRRTVVRAIRQPVSTLARRPIQRGGNWVVTGGARGITAFAAQELAARYGWKLHLVGLSPRPATPEDGTSYNVEELRRYRLDVMQGARAAGKNPVKEWEKVEKSFEINRTLKALRERGIAAEYHSCDVADRQQLAEVLDRVRRTDGLIHGIIHGAGVGKDARFERKEPARVEECIRAKVDGARVLMELTRQDPLTHFVAFGSISGRFGANGHTDYSLANDMLCKELDWFRRQRPEVRAVGFHWHAWGDVGMATKPETKLALEMVGMQFMPASEGLTHLEAELMADTAESEVLITDDKYYRMFYPAETLVAERSTTAETISALLADAVRSTSSDGTSTFELALDPVQEPFLVEHRLDDRPLLPIVIGLELLSEAARLCHGSGYVVGLADVEAVSGLRFFTDRPQVIRLRATKRSSNRFACELTADFHARDGKLIQANRCYLRGEVQVADEPPQQVRTSRVFPEPTGGTVEYPGRGSKMYLGPPFRYLKRIQLAEDQALGRIMAPALVELAGAERTVEGWVVPSAALDSCLFATGILCWHRVVPGPTLPVRFGSIQLGRLPQPGEACIVETRLKGREGSHAIFDFTLFGDDGTVLVDVTGYHVAWLTI